MPTFRIFHFFYSLLLIQDGRLRLGDHIVCIRDYNVRGYGPDQVATVLRQTISSCLSDSLLISNIVADSLPIDDTLNVALINTTPSSVNTATTATATTTVTPTPNTLSAAFTSITDTNIKLDRSSSTPSQIVPSHMESDEIIDTSKRLLANPSVLIRLIVARPANGNPVDLSEISLKQQILCQQNHVLE
ncbi:unnamed protein product [Heterobilharzia americana]|nr:unnamed protein product [Heterobilharzia americana]